MKEKVGVDRLRASVGYHLGNRVRIKRNCGRHRTDLIEGILKEAYPSIFVVELLEHGDAPKTLSFSYADLLTRDIQMMLCEPQMES